mmetsp:Transcript_20356/g.57826  ORF Transcript_20356/g.57826 Transcript_20356/m.57826 type:complete len:95 (+) Transcript_20356:2026-2310(+)
MTNGIRHDGTKESVDDGWLGGKGETAKHDGNHARTTKAKDRNRERKKQSKRVSEAAGCLCASESVVQKQPTSQTNLSVLVRVRCDVALYKHRCR